MGLEFNCATGEEAVVATPPVPIGDLYAARLAELADRRWQQEIAGIVVLGMPIRTDRESQGLLTSAYIMAKLNPTFAVNWKAGNGQFIAADAPMIVAVGDAVTAHVQGCFDREAELTADLTAAFEAEDRAALDALDTTAGWPAG